MKLADVVKELMKPEAELSQLWRERLKQCEDFPQPQIVKFSYNGVGAEGVVYISHTGLAGKRWKIVCTEDME
jgi:hypothetical protein